MREPEITGADTSPPARCYRPDSRHPERLQRTSEPGAPAVADLGAAAIHGALRAFIDDVHYPCLGAKSAIHAGSYQLGVYGELGELASTEGLARDLAAFVADREAMEADFATFVAVFEGPVGVAPESFEKLLWQLLQRLHDADGEPWDESVSADPEDPHFSFSFAGSAFFVVGLAPTSERLSRRFPWHALVFNPHAQFERLRAQHRWERMQEVIRRRETELQGDINPVLRDFGDESEARQYSGRSVEPDWRAPFVAKGDAASPAGGCPIHRAHKAEP